MRAPPADSSAMAVVAAALDSTCEGRAGTGAVSHLQAGLKLHILIALILFP